LKNFLCIFFNTKKLKKSCKRVAINKGQCYNLIIKREEEIKMARSKTRGWYVFADGYTCWYHGLSGAEKKMAVREHGAIVRFTPTD
jgi:hypothetical protein